MSATSELFAVEARRAYDRYLLLCIERPNLTSYDNAKSKIAPPNKLWTALDEESSRYVWFVAYMLKVFDDLLRYDLNENWTDALYVQLEFHVPTLKALWPKHWSEIFSKKLAKLVNKVIESHANA